MKRIAIIVALLALTGCASNPKSFWYTPPGALGQLATQIGTSVANSGAAQNAAMARYKEEHPSYTCTSNGYGSTTCTKD